MEIRSVTFFADPTRPLDWLPAAAAGARAALQAASYCLQTVRLATTPFPDWMQDEGQVAQLADGCRAAGVDYLALGPVRLDDDVAWLERLPAIIGAHETVFASAEIADRAGRVDTGRVARVAALVKELAALRPDGFANLYFTASANCPAGSPFFPVAYHDGASARSRGWAGLALATEAADLAVDACSTAGTLAEVRSQLVATLDRETAALAQVAAELAGRHNLHFGGIDLSLAPYPQQARSLGAAMEALGVPAVGGHGSLFAAAFLAECVQRADFPRCGFSGLMFPVLEDATLAQRAAEGLLTISDLLLYSAVCGAGLDTLPLPGDVSAAELAGILLDVAALAVRLDKPLTARLMPLPGLAAGGPVTFDFPYFADSRVMAVKGVGLAGSLSRPERVVLHPRRPSV